MYSLTWILHLHGSRWVYVIIRQHPADSLTLPCGKCEVKYWQIEWLQVAWTAVCKRLNWCIAMYFESTMFISLNLPLIAFNYLFCIDFKVITTNSITGNLLVEICVIVCVRLAWRFVFLGYKRETIGAFFVD